MKSMKTRFLTILFTILLMVTTWSQTKTFGTKVKIKNMPELTTIDTLVTATPTGVLSSVKYTSFFSKLLADLQANGSLGGGSTINSVADINDVTLTNPSGNQALIYNGSAWVNQTLPSVVTDHTALSNIGTNSHAAIDAHIANGNVHFTQSAISIPSTQISDFSTAVQALNTDSQSLSISGQNLSISNGNTIALPSIDDTNYAKINTANTFAENLTFNKDLVFNVEDAINNKTRLIWKEDDGTEWFVISPNWVSGAMSFNFKAANWFYIQNNSNVFLEFDTGSNVIGMPSTSISAINNIKGKAAVTYEWVDSFVTKAPNYITTASVSAIDLSNNGGNHYTTPQTNSTYTVSNSTNGAVSYVIINTTAMASYPTVTGATLIASPDFVAGTHRMTVFNEAGTIKYFFTKE